jgi:putative serine protease PepD
MTTTPEIRDPVQDGPAALGAPAGPDITWAAGASRPPATTPGESFALPASMGPPPRPTAPQPPAGGGDPPPSTGRVRRAGIAGVLVLAALTGAGAGAATAGLLGRAPGNTPGIVQERGSSAASPVSGTTQAAAHQILPSVVQVRSGQGSGSGVVIDARGHVLTNHHVVEGVRSVSLVDSSGRTVTAQVIGSDAGSDIAVLRAGDGQLPAANLGVSADLAIGQPVIAVGSPLGLNGTVTSGVISAVDRRSSSEAMIQTDAPINPGNSGGPLVDLDGRVVGINTSIATLGGGRAGNIGIGFAVPIDRAAAVAQQILTRG